MKSAYESGTSHPSGVGGCQIRIQVAPAPPPQPLMRAIEKIAQDNPPQIPA